MFKHRINITNDKGGIAITKVNSNKNHINSLVDIKSITIDTKLSKEEKIKLYMEQIKNPLNFKCDDVEIVVTFVKEGLTLEERIKGLIM